MPTWWSGRMIIRNWCRKAYSWSTHRGGCRFDVGHAGPCKPGRYKR